MKGKCLGVAGSQYPDTQLLLYGVLGFSELFCAEEDFLVWEELQDLLDRLQLACREMNLSKIREILLEAVDGFEPKEKISDPLWQIKSDEYATDLNNNDLGAEGAGGESAKVTRLFRE